MGRGGYRKGAGRPRGTTKGDGLPSKVIRVSSDVTKEQCEAIPELVALIDHWELECDANLDKPRYYFLRKAIDEIRALGF